MIFLQNSVNKSVMLVVIMLFSLVCLSQAYALNEEKKIVIQVSTSDPLTQKIALNNAVNLQKHYGMDNISVEVVAFGPGLGLLTSKNDQSARVKSLAMQNIEFSACSNTMKKMEKKSGKKVALTEGVNTVPAGAARILELQEQGYAYLRP